MIENNEPHVRALISMSSQQDILHFIDDMYTTEDSFVVEDFKARQRVNARSLLGMMYAMADFGAEMYLVNTSRNGIFPGFVDKYRRNSSD